ncbi:MAG TPA: type VI secretion system contractile sheath large subunit [Pyrinomonadaceae bacterium]|nr:type VI secretion system contractile sheath large subunit [Pyrinomonadaceae bacterium]
MPQSFSLETPEFNLVETVETETRREKIAPDPETPFRIALIGDFSGRAARGVEETGRNLATRRAIFIDRDNFDEVLARIEPAVRLGEGEKLTLRFNELDDFHPDRIFDRVELFAQLKETRRRLGHPKTFDQAAAEVRRWAGIEERRGDKNNEAENQTDSETDSGGGSLLDQMLDAAESSTAAGKPKKRTSPPTHDAALNDFLRRIVEPHVAPEVDPQRDELIAAVDAGTGELMRAILHHPDFQALEAIWRSTFLVVSRLETGPNLKVYLLDISKEELIADLTATEDLRKSGFYQLIVEESVGTPGADPWAVLAGDFTFDYTRDDVELLGRVGLVARASGAPFLAAAHSHFARCESLAATPDPADWTLKIDEDARAEWDALRESPVAPFLGLALPRFLLRLPYGAQTEDIEAFDFEEFTGDGDHESYLWGNPAFACAYLLGEAFSRDGWDLQPGAGGEIENLPLHVYQSDGESQTKPCAEVLLTQRAAEKILENGLMAFLSYRQGDKIRLARFQSIAEPLKNLAGLWD